MGKKKKGGQNKGGAGGGSQGTVTTPDAAVDAVKEQEVQAALPALSASATEEPAARQANVAPAAALDTSYIQAEFDGDDETASLLQRPEPESEPEPEPEPEPEAAAATAATATTAMDMDDPASMATEAAAAAAAPMAVGIASIPAGEKPIAALDASDTLAAPKLLREAFFACDINQGGTIDAKELCAMLSALNDDRDIDVTLEMAAGLIEKVDREVDEEQESEEAVHDAKKHDFNTDGAVHMNIQPQRHWCRHNFGCSSRAAGAVKFKGVRCRYGGSGALEEVTLELDDKAGVVLMTEPGEDGKVCGPVSVAGCQVGMLASPPPGYPHSFQLKTIAAASTGDKLFTLACPSKKDAAHWVGRLKKFSAKLEVAKDKLDVYQFRKCMEDHVTVLLPNLDWRLNCTRIAQLRRAFDTADADGSLMISKYELETVVLAADPTRAEHFDAADLDLLWELIAPATPAGGQAESVDFATFLHGMGRVGRTDARSHNGAYLSEMLTMGAPNRWALLSLLVDTPVSEIEEQRLHKQAKHPFERLGMRMIKHHQEPLDKAKLRANLLAACKGTLRKHSAKHVANVKAIRRKVLWQVLLIALVTNALPAAWENYTTWRLETNGLAPIYLACHDCDGLFDCTPQLNQTEVVECDSFVDWHIGLQFWAVLVPFVLCCIVSEIILLGLAATHASAEIVSEFHYRLSPLNQERAYVAFSLIRATFEMGNSETKYDAHDKEDSTYGHKLRIVFMLVLYKAKILLLGFIIKQIFKYTTPIEYSTWLMGHASIYASVFWDVLITKAIMDNVQRRAQGVTASVEIFNEIWDELIEAPHKAAAKTDGKTEGQTLDHPTISMRGREEIARAVGVAIAEQGSMYPPMDLLLRHIVQFFRLDPAAAVLQPGSIDSRKKLMEGLKDPAMPLVEKRLVSAVHLLAVMLDGDISSKEMKTFNAMQAAEPNVCQAGDLRRRLEDLAYDYRQLGRVVTGEDVIQGLDPAWTCIGHGIGEDPAGCQKTVRTKRTLSRQIEELWITCTWALV